MKNQLFNCSTFQGECVVLINPEEGQQPLSSPQQVCISATLPSPKPVSLPSHLQHNSHPSPHAHAPPRKERRSPHAHAPPRKDRLHRWVQHGMSPVPLCPCPVNSHVARTHAQNANQNLHRLSKLQESQVGYITHAYRHDTTDLLLRVFVLPPSHPLHIYTYTHMTHTLSRHVCAVLWGHIRAAGETRTSDHPRV